MEKSKVIQFEKNDKDNGKEQARQILKNGILDMSVKRLIQMVNFGLCGNIEVMTDLCGTSNYFNHIAYIGFLNKGGRKMSRMKFYLSTKDKKISIQKDIIEKLQDENHCLKEQLKLYNVEKYKEKMRELDECYKKYSELSKELEGYKSEYLHLLSDIKRGV